MEAIGLEVEEPVNPMDTALQWIGFVNADVRERILEEGFGTFDDLIPMNEKDIRDMSESYGRRTVADGRFIFGTRRIKYLVGLIHWVHDFTRINGIPSLEEFGDDAVEFRKALDEAAHRAECRKRERDQADTVSKAADPGKFKDERKWSEWEPSFVNYISTIQGVNGVPLSYIVREMEESDVNGTFDTFNERSIACSKLTGVVFQTDARKVHQLLKSFLQAETAEQWIKPLDRKQNGRADMIALRNHYSGEGNTSRRIATAEKLRETLHYKNERSLPFSTFLDKMQRMFNIFKEGNEEISEQAKVRMLLQKVQHPQLQAAVDALRVRATIDGLTFTVCANHLSAQVSELPDPQTPRKVSSAGTSSKKKSPETKRIRGGGSSSPGSKRDGIHMPDGSIWTGFYAEWDQLSKEDRQTVIDTRATNKAKGGRRKVAEVGSTKLKEIKTQVAALKRKLASMKSNKESSADSDDDAEVPDNAGDAFGGRQSKKSKKD
jgi:hypothetical protein